MNKKPPVSRFSNPKAVAHPDDRHWHNGGDIEIHMYARSLQRAAKALVENLNLEPNPKTAWDACPVVLLYRQALELHLKALVDEGGNFLKERTDSISLYKTHSLRWLAQIVCQIIKKVGWESEFKCAGIASLSDFSALVNEVEALDPAAVAVHSGSRGRDGSVPHQLQPPNVLRLAGKLDGLLDLLDVTADALAATGDHHAETTAAETKLPVGGNIKPTIH
jgi:hypothetical protein